MQTNRVGIDKREEIKEANLDRCVELFQYGARRLAFREFAPLKLVVFPEVFLQGWNDNPAPYDNIYTKVAKDMAITVKVSGDLIRWYLNTATCVKLVCVLDAIKREQIITGYFETA